MRGAPTLQLEEVHRIVIQVGFPAVVALGRFRVLVPGRILHLVELRAVLQGHPAVGVVDREDVRLRVGDLEDLLVVAALAAIAEAPGGALAVGEGGDRSQTAAADELEGRLWLAGCRRRVGHLLQVIIRVVRERELPAQLVGDLGGGVVRGWVDSPERHPEGADAVCAVRGELIRVKTDAKWQMTNDR